MQMELIGDSKLRSRMVMIARKLNSGPVIRGVFKLLGVMVLRDQQRFFRQMATRKVGLLGWPSLSPITVMLRRKGAGGKIEDEADIVARRMKMEPLRDTGLLYRSLAPSIVSRGSMFDIRDNSVEVGTVVPYAKKLFEGGKTTFNFDSEKKSRFTKNVKMVLPGRKKTKRARKNWNPFYFKMRAVMRKMSGKSYRVPPRPFMRKVSKDERKKYLAAFTRALNRILKGQP